jgi:hypothetical protein
MANPYRELTKHLPPEEIRAWATNTIKELAATKGAAKVRDSEAVCVRCAPHLDCISAFWCEGCAAWICCSCWYACNVGPQPHGEAGARWLSETLEFLATTGKQPDGRYVLYCGRLGAYAHLDGGRPYHRLGSL